MSLNLFRYSILTTVLALSLFIFNRIIFVNLLKLSRSYWYDLYYSRIYFSSLTSYRCWFGYEWCQFSYIITFVLLVSACLFSSYVFYLVFKRGIKARIYLEIFIIIISVIIIEYSINYINARCKGEYMAIWDDCRGTKAAISNWLMRSKGSIITGFALTSFLILIFRIKSGLLNLPTRNKQ